MRAESRVQNLSTEHTEQTGAPRSYPNLRLFRNIVSRPFCGTVCRILGSFGDLEDRSDCPGWNLLVAKGLQRIDIARAAHWYPAR